MRTVWIGAFGAALLLVACAAPQPVQMQTQMQTKFDYDKHKPYTQKGNNTIKGQALLQSLCGGFMPCAEDDVLMVPATPYFRKQLSTIRTGKKPLDNIDPAGKTVIRHSQADARGIFTFNDVPDGNWFVVVKVKWTVGYSPQGGELLKEVNVANGETKQVRLTESDFIGR